MNPSRNNHRLWAVVFAIVVAVNVYYAATTDGPTWPNEVAYIIGAIGLGWELRKAL